MNGSPRMETPAAGTASKMLGMLIAAAAIGIVFNSMNPLGIRPANPTSSGAPLAVASGDLYENETLSAKLGGNSAISPPSAAEAGGVYENETIRTRLGSGAAPAQPVQAHSDTITWLEAKKLQAAGRVVLVDARDAVYYQSEHIPGAVSLSAGQSTPAALAAFAARYPKNTPLVVYCGSLKCPLSRRLIAVLTGQLGFTDVRDMAGGYVEYRETEAALANGGAR